MPFQPSETLPDFEKLKAIFSNAGFQIENYPLFQTINNFLDSTSKLKSIFDNRIVELETIVSGLSLGELNVNSLIPSPEGEDFSGVESFTPGFDIAGFAKLKIFTPGSVIFANANGLLDEDNSNFFWDDSNNRLGIGLAVPLTKLHIVATDANTFTLDVYSNSASNAFALRRARGTPSTPTTVNLLDALGALVFQGHDGSIFTNSRIVFVGLAAENFTASAQGSLCIIQTTPIGSVTAGTCIAFLTGPNVLIGATSLFAEPNGTFVLYFDNGTAPTTMGSNTAGIFANDVSGVVTMFAISEAAKLTRLTDPFGVLDANAQETQIRHAATEITGMSGASVTATNLIPAGSFLIGVTIRVTTLITGATGFDIGDGTDVNRWGDDIAVAAGTTTSIANFTEVAPIQPELYPAANNVVLTNRGGNFTAGAVRITAHYMNLVPSTS